MDGASSLGLWMLPVAAALIFSGLPAWTALLTTALGFALGAVALGVPWHDFGVLPARLTGLLESDLLQALPLFVLMGCVLNRLPVARGMLRVCEGAFTRLRAGAAATPLAALTVSALLAPVNGSVGASVGMLWRTVNPTLEQQRMPAARRAALIAACSTLGVVIPPSLVLVLLGDAMMTAHTIAVNKTGAMVRIINTQDVMHAALLPAALLVAGYALWLLAQGWRARLGTPQGGAAPGAVSDAGQQGSHGAAHDASQDAEPPLTRGTRITALAAIAFILTLLGAVATGVMYAVEAAAFAAVAALAYGVATRQLRGPVLRGALHDALALSGAL
ncbi:MAG: TRAP transporter large permease subunit, partial [Betaproteobacteria bacterium]|nr:TRAP transporter large permease subunit [Betaproteobacteria bacterium]